MKMKTVVLDLLALYPANQKDRESQESPERVKQTGQQRYSVVP